MVKSSIEKIAEDIGFDIGMSDDITQSLLIKGFCKALYNSMDDRDRDTQICSIVNNLDPKSMKMLKKFYDFIELKESE